MFNSLVFINLFRIEYYREVNFTIFYHKLILQKFQNIFNDMYNSIFELTITNKLKTPQNGIKFPHKENKQNLFRRQLILEDHAYDSSLRKFKEGFLKLNE